MTKREIAALACKILSLYVVIQGLTSVQGSIQFFVASADFLTIGPSMSVSARVLISLVPFILHVSCAMFLWLFADGIAAAMVRDSQDQLPPDYSDLRATDLKAIAFSVVGVLILMQGIIQLSNILISFLAGASSTVERYGLLAAIVSSILQIIIGLWLLFGGRRLVRMAGTVGQAVLRGPDGPPPSAPDDV